MSKIKQEASQLGPPSDVEHIKEKSNYLRGTLQDTLTDPLSAGIPDDDNRLMKFHGSYLQDDRDVRNERRLQKLEPAYQFMVRVRAPGGVATPDQWLTMDRIAGEYADGSLKLTTRQAFQMHGIVKWNMKNTMKEINESLLDTLAACGDVNRNVMCNPNPYQSDIHSEVYEWSKKLSEHLSPKTRAYHEIWVGDEKVAGTEKEMETEPLYGKTYLPRKFKIGMAVPPSNDVDVFSQDLGFIAILEENKLKGFNVLIGGGMGMSHGDTKTYPQVARLAGFCKPEQILEVAENVISIQRDYGNRSVRKNARFKYTIDRLGLSVILDELHERLGWELEPGESYQFEHNGDRFGWVKGANDHWHFTLFIQNGRVRDDGNALLKTGLREIAKVHHGEFRLTPNQNLIISNVSEEKRKEIESLIDQYGLSDGSYASALRRNSIACVALPTCGLAMAESERYLPSLLDTIEEILNEAGLREEDIVIRMSGCPNGCSRAPLAEIAFIGKAPGKYNLYLGGGFTGERLNKLYRENIGEEEIISALTPIFHDYAANRQEGEHFGDFTIRAGYVKSVQSGLDFHEL
ncbi:assimilatory sulfite reductase (NADPH) hemoprotein subunit [Alteribacillus iranensis]|uniref:Sulfite reductase [NADPH] hemoprotein beta-component n=1 Tax=Alteribacillus iranensis TaxID=930128 RepID=A0A1I1ZXM3_9BACI|nr:assimilatory sulfite reductase (NADPH) hemoprotein subunit [Alteribacillus iranensis]SFE36411.1 sulfite reductase (NADPH) beta subunit [Alteribacillus iranensis]